MTRAVIYVCHPLSPIPEQIARIVTALGYASRERAAGLAIDDNIGVYIDLSWEDDIQAYYVAGHVTPAEFRAELAQCLGCKAPVIADDVEINHGFGYYKRVENDDYGNRRYEFFHASTRTGQPVTYWEVPSPVLAVRILDASGRWVA